MSARTKRYGKGLRGQSKTLLPAPYQEYEKGLSEFAARSEKCTGRPKQLTDDPWRSPWERDYHRILYSDAFKRLKHKTQIFYLPENDHICTRMDHSLQVASISDSLCTYLKLNSYLALAIAAGHDLGHAPFGHTGEEALDEISIEAGLGTFSHEANALRVINIMKELHGESLFLTYEVQDGIVCHYGEQFDHVLIPDKGRDITRVSAASAHMQYPGTLEGCVVRYVDRVAYLAADLQDAKELGIINKSQVPIAVRRVLGEDTGEIVGHVIEDILRESSGQNLIATSDGIFKVLKELYEFSDANIYNCSFIMRQKPWVKNILKQLFEGLKDVLNATDRGKDKKLMAFYPGETNAVLFNFLDAIKYPEEVPLGRIILDYMSGMTDSFAKRSFDELIPIRTPLRRPR